MVKNCKKSFLQDNNNNNNGGNNNINGGNINKVFLQPFKVCLNA